jgi:hypothetical protein
LKDRRAATDGKLSAKDWKTYDAICAERDARTRSEGGDDQRRRMAGDQRPQDGKLAKILAAETGRR